MYDNVTGYPEYWKYKESDDEDENDDPERYDAPRHWKLQHLADMAEAERRASRQPAR